MVKSKVILPVFVVGSVGLAQVFGPHHSHIELDLQTQMPQLVGTLASDAMSTATVTRGQVLFEMEDFR